MSGQKITLQTMLGNYPNTAALKSGALKSELIDFQFADVAVANTAFKSVVRDAKFDLSELAIATFLQAKAFNKPYVLLPAVVVGRGQHHTIAYNPAKGHLDPKDLHGKRVGVRAYTVTTGAWVRGILAEDYGIDIDKVKWISFEDPHVAEYQDPAIVTRAPAGKNLQQMLLDGELDAAVVGDKLPEGLKHLIPDPEAVARNWANRHGGVPINHMVVVRESIAKSRPDVVAEAFRLLKESKQAANLPASGTGMDAIRFGVENNRKALETIIDYCAKQKLIPRRYEVDELFDDVTRKLV